jgi:hypothetical protein
MGTPAHADTERAAGDRAGEWFKARKFALERKRTTGDCVVTTGIRREFGAQSVIPAKRGKKTWRIHGARAEMRRSFPQRLYRRRALIESLFSSILRKLSASAPGRSLPTQMRQALLLGLSFNLYPLRHRYLFSRMSTEPNRLWPRDAFANLDYRFNERASSRLRDGLP